MKAPILDRLRALVSKPKKPVPRVIPKFPAVEVTPGLIECCDAVRAIRGQRYLMTNAPSIPVAGCDAEKCKCRYTRFTDRRQEERRGEDAGVATTVYSATAEDKRSKTRGRRSTDHEPGADEG